MLLPLLISLKTVLLSTFLTGTAAIFLARARMMSDKSWLMWLDSVLLLPLALPPTVIGLVLLLTLGRESPVGQLLQQVGINIVFSWPATVIAAVTVSFPIMYSMTLAAFRMVNRDLLDTARVLGCGRWQTLYHVLLPLAWPGVACGLLLSAARALGEFGATLMLAGNIPGKTQTAPLAIYFAVENGDIHYAAGLCLVLIVLSASSMVLIQSLDSFKSLLKN